ncbi:MAG: phosphoribosyl-AMP cyclohydrolase [Planctomycetales bacterium]|nr:phosphoribosyl-AMP cyclohydrolase [Planctomycetales bacterium]
MVSELPELPVFADENTLVPAVAQDAASGEVLMLAYMNRAAWEATLATQQAHYFSRSRGRMWKKGESSGHVQKVVGVRVDCDGDAVLLLVEQSGGAACHEGFSSCFFREWESGDWRQIGQRVFDPKQVYGASQ